VKAAEADGEGVAAEEGEEEEDSSDDAPAYR
jgi:hypothetical protein